MERAGPAIRAPPWDVCSALHTESSLEWRKVQKVLGSLWEALQESAETPPVEGESWEGCTTALPSCTLEVCLQSFSGFRSAPRAQGCF